MYIVHTTLPGRYQTIVLLLAVAAAYVWLRLPTLSAYSLQAVALTTCIYLVLHLAERKKGQVWHVLPKSESALLSLVTFTILLLIGATGNLNSPLYPLTYIHLFFLVMSSSPRTAIVTTIAVMWFHLTLAPQITPSAIAHILILPIVLIFFEFAKQQHELAITEKQALAQKNQELSVLCQEEYYLTSQLKQATIQQNTVNHQSVNLEHACQQLQSQIHILQQQVLQSQHLLTTLSQHLRVWQNQFFTCEPEEKRKVVSLLQQIDQVTAESATSSKGKTP